MFNSEILLSQISQIMSNDSKFQFLIFCRYAMKKWIHLLGTS